MDRTCFVLLGTGPAGMAVSRALSVAPYAPGFVLSRDIDRARDAARFLGIEGRGSDDPTRIPADAGTVIVAVPDGAIHEAARKLGLAGVPRGRLLVHLSGALPAAVMRMPETEGADLASMHPMASFPAGASAERPLSGVSVAIEGARREFLADWARAAGACPVFIDPSRKAAYHAAGVLASNALVALVACARDLLIQAGVPEDRAMGVLEPLVRGAVENALRDGPQRALTGPITRSDVDTVQRHVDALARCDPDALALYRAAGLLTLRVARSRGGLDTAAFQRLREMLDAGDEGAPGS